MNTAKRKIVVFGATGNQGGAAARYLLKDPRWEVTVITRDPRSAAALKLQCLGAVIQLADPASQASVAKAVKGAYGVFFITQPWSAGNRKCNIDKEMVQGKNIIWACQLADIKHVVFGSVINPDDQPTGVPQFDSKFELEQLLKNKGIPYTIIRCGVFMDTIGKGFMQLNGQVLKGYLPGNTMVPFVSYDDVGACTAAVFSWPELYTGRTVDLAGDLLSGNQLAALSSRVYPERYFIYAHCAAFFLKLFQPAKYLLLLYFERYGSGAGHKRMVKTVNRSRSEFPDLKKVADILSNLL